MLIKTTFVGDLMCKLPQLQVSQREFGYDFSPVFNKVAKLFQQSDYVVGNLETPVAGSELGYTKTPSNFNSPVEFAMAAKEAGFDLFSIANNHCLDRGVQGLFNTIDNLRAINVDYTGAYKSSEESREPFVKNFDGLKIAFLAFTYGTNSEWLNNCLDDEHKDCVDLFRKQDAYIVPKPVSFKSIIIPIKNVAKKYLPQSIREKIKPIVIEDCVRVPEVQQCDVYYDKKVQDKIRVAKENSDVVIMYMHSGGQFNSVVGDYTKSLAHRLVDYGCDIVIGSHPHCVLNYEFYKGKIIVYSLGNFCYTPDYGYHYDGVYSDYSVVLNMYFDKEEKILKKTTINVTKTIVEEDGNSVVYPISTLLKIVSEKQKNRLIEDVSSVLHRFFGQEIEYNSELDEIEVPF